MKITPERFNQLTGKYRGLKIALVGDFCLDRYLEIDPNLKETSIETGLEVYNVVNVRPQPGGAGTILNNLVALGVGKIYAIGFCGDDGEGFELKKELSKLPNVDLRYFLQTNKRRTFTYCKPLIITPGKPPRELNRLDSKNWTPTPPSVEKEIINAIEDVCSTCDAMIVLEQTDVANTGVVTANVLKKIGEVSEKHRELPIIADSRRGLSDFPPLIYKMNRYELAKLLGRDIGEKIGEIKTAAQQLCQKTGREVFITLGENGIIGSSPRGEVVHVPGIPPAGEIDIVGAGDSVTANLACAIAAAASMEEALILANCAAWIVIHKLGTTGTASVEEIKKVLNL